MKFLNYLQEKLNPSEFRKYVKMWKESGMDKQFDDVFKGKHRVVIDYTPNVDKKSDYEKTITDFLYDKGWIVTDYIKGLAKKANRTMKIGKVLQSYIDKDKPGYADTLLRYFQRDEVRAAGKGDLIIVISRHAYDIAGMSTDRGWTSCQDIRDGDMSAYVSKDIKAGTIIAYLTRNDDKNLQHPIGRVLLKPFFNNKNEKIMIAVNKKYGEAPLDFIETVQKWADKNLNKNKYGIFKRHTDVYPEGENIKTKVPEDKDKFFEQFKIIINTPEDLIKVAKENFKWLKSWYLKIFDRDLPDDVWFNYEMKFNNKQILDYLIEVWKQSDRLKAWSIFSYSLRGISKNMQGETMFRFLTNSVLDQKLLDKINTKEEWDENQHVQWLRPNERDKYWEYFQRIKKEVQ